MDEFIKVSSGVKRIVNIILSLKSNEVLEVIPDRAGKKGVYYARTIRKEVTSETINNATE